MDEVGLEILREVVVLAIGECSDGGLLDLIYKMLISGDIR